MVLDERILKAQKVEISNWVLQEYKENVMLNQSTKRSLLF